MPPSGQGQGPTTLLCRFAWWIGLLELLRKKLTPRSSGSSGNSRFRSPIRYSTELGSPAIGTACKNGAVRRDSKRANQLAEQTGAATRDLEDWSRPIKGISYLAPEESSGDAPLVTALLEVGTKRDRASTALIVASNYGLAIADYKVALSRKLKLDVTEVTSLVAPLEADEDGELTDEGSNEAERRAGIVASTMYDDDLALAMDNKMAKSAPGYREPAEALRHSWLTMLVTMASGASHTPLRPSQH